MLILYNTHSLSVCKLIIDQQISNFLTISQTCSGEFLVGLRFVSGSDMKSVVWLTEVFLSLYLNSSAVSLQTEQTLHIWADTMFTCFIIYNYKFPFGFVLYRLLSYSVFVLRGRRLNTNSWAKMTLISNCFENWWIFLSKVPNVVFFQHLFDDLMFFYLFM